MSVNQSNTLWRLSTIDGTKVKLLKRSGDVSRDSGSATEEYLICACDLENFIKTAIPTPVVAFGGVQYLARASFYGIPSLIVDEVHFESVTDSKPIDPFGSDITAPDGTYEEFVKVTVTYKPRSKTKGSSNSDTNDPLTFLEVSSDVSGEYVCDNLTGKFYWYDNEYNPDTDKWEATSAGTEIESPDTLQTIISPVKSWSVSWPQIPYDFFYNTLAPKLDYALGTMNSKSVEIFHGKKIPRTLLLEGYSTKEQATWDTEDVKYPPISLDMKFKEKGFWSNNTDGPVFVTWGHTYVKGKGWRAINAGNAEIDSVARQLIHSTDFNDIWNI
jgi:hypothetical protein